MCVDAHSCACLCTKCSPTVFLPVKPHLGPDPFLLSCQRFRLEGKPHLWVFLKPNETLPFLERPWKLRAVSSLYYVLPFILYFSLFGGLGDSPCAYILLFCFIRKNGRRGRQAGLPSDGCASPSLPGARRCSLRLPERLLHRHDILSATVHHPMITNTWHAGAVGVLSDRMAGIFPARWGSHILLLFPMKEKVLKIRANMS